VHGSMNGCEMLNALRGLGCVGAGITWVRVPAGGSLRRGVHRLVGGDGGAASARVSAVVEAASAVVAQKA
jgi:hypothetical protein